MIDSPKNVCDYLQTISSEIKNLESLIVLKNTCLEKNNNPNMCADFYHAIQMTNSQIDYLRKIHEIKHLK